MKRGQSVGQPAARWEEHLLPSLGHSARVHRDAFSLGLSPFRKRRQPLSQTTAGLMECGRCFRKGEALGKQPSTAFPRAKSGGLTAQLPSLLFLLPFTCAPLHPAALQT